MEIAQLVLDYLKVLVWPAVVAIVLFMARKSLPTLLPDLAERLESFKAGGAEIKFRAAQQAALAAADQLSKAAEPATSGQSQIADLSPDLRRLTPRSSASKIFRNMRVTLYSQIKRVCNENRLPFIWKGEPTTEPPSGVLIAAPAWEDITNTMRSIAEASGVEGWERLADAVEEMAVFSAEELPHAIKSATASLLSQNAIRTAGELAAATKIA